MARSNEPAPAAWRPTVGEVDDLPRSPLRRPGGHYVTLVDDAAHWVRPVVLHVTLAPASDPGPRHRHRRAENTYLVVEGELEVLTERGDVTLGAGQQLTIPPGIGHATANRSPAIARFLAIYTHPIEEDFEVATW